MTNASLGAGSWLRAAVTSVASRPTSSLMPSPVTAEMRGPSHVISGGATSALDPTVRRGRSSRTGRCRAGASAGAREQVETVAAELVEEDLLLLLGRSFVGGREVEQDDEHAGALDVAEEA